MKRNLGTPGQRLAYLPYIDTATLAECLVAFANGDGGLIVVGLDENGRVTPDIWEEDVEAALLEATGYCRPPVPTQWRPVERGQGHTLIGIDVPRSPEMHSLSDGRVLVRSGHWNRALSKGEVEHLAGNKDTAVFETEVVPGSRPDDLDQHVIREYMDKRQSRGAARVTSVPETLFEVGATNRAGLPTTTGILLFGKKPQIFFPQSGIVFVRFSGTKPQGEDGGIGYGRRAEINGPLARVIERAWNIVHEEMRVGAMVQNLERHEITEYPRFAVREALVNAVSHRDYRITGRRIEIRMYADRLEVISPGGLPGYMTLDNLVDEHFSRNPRLVNGLYQWGYIEELGLGIDQMIEDMVNAGHKPPEFKATPYLFTVILNKKQGQFDLPNRNRNINDRQAQALLHVREHGSITNRDYRQLCSDVSTETLRLDLADLVERGLLLKIGSKRGTHYILK